jgi:hypothetical protein
MTSKDGNPSVSVGPNLQDLNQGTLTSVAGTPAAPPSPSEEGQTASIGAASTTSLEAANAATQLSVPKTMIRGGASKYASLTNVISYLQRTGRKNRKHIADHSFEQSGDYPTNGERLRAIFKLPSKAGSSIIDELNLDPLPQPLRYIPTRQGSQGPPMDDTAASEPTDLDATRISRPCTASSAQGQRENSLQLPKNAFDIGDIRTILPPGHPSQRV